MLGGLRRWLDLREDERVSVAQAVAVLFGLIAAHTMLETARDALFLEKLPASRLSLVYALLALISIGVARVNAVFVQRFGRRNALIFSLMAAAYGTMMLYLSPRTPEMAFVLYVWSGLIGTVLVVQFWMLAGNIFTVAQGKRLFGPLAAGGVLGAVVGASVAAAVLAFFDVGSLLLIAPLILIASATIVTAIPSDQTAPEVAKSERTKEEPLSKMIRHPYVARLSLALVLGTCAVLTADYLFKAVTARSMPPEHLGQFLAGYYAVLNAISLLVQLFFANYFIRRVGVVGSMSLLPVAMLLGATGTILTHGALLGVLFTRGADGALRHSLNRVSSELLWMPVPDQIKSRLKSLADTVFNRGAQAAMGGFLLLLAMGGFDTPIVLSAIVVTFSVAGLIVNYQMRKPYFDLFRRALAKDQVAGDLGAFKLDLNSAEMIIESLSSREPERAVAAIELLHSQKRAKLIPALILYHESPLVLVRALEVIAVPERKDWVSLAERLLSHENEGVRVAAVRALVAADQHELVMGRLEDISAAVRAHTAFSLVQHTGGVPIEDAHVKDLLQISGEKRQPARYALLDAICLRGGARWTPVIEEIAKDADDYLNEKLADAAMRVRDERFIEMLIGRLCCRDGRSSLRRAIVSYGEPALSLLERMMRDPNTDPRILLHIPRTISQFKNQRAAELLIELMTSEGDGSIRFKALRGLGRLVDESTVKIDPAKIGGVLLRNLSEYMRLLALNLRLNGHQEVLPEDAKPSAKLLSELLEDKQRQAMERVFRLLKVVHRSEDLRVVYDAVRSGDKRTRANALEFLDALTLRYPIISPAHEKSRELLRVLADDLPPEERVVRATPFLAVPPPETAEQALITLLRENDPSVATIAAHHALKLGVVDLTREVASAGKERRFLEVREVARAG